MPRFLIRLLIFFAAIFGIACLGIRLLLEPVSRKAMNFAVENLHFPNLSLSEPSFDKVRISSINSITWDNFVLTATVALQDASKKSLVFSVETRELTVELAKLFEGLFIIHLNGLNLSAEYLPKQDPETAQDAPEALREASLAVPIRLNITSLSASAAELRNLAYTMKQFLAEGTTPISIEFSGEGIITIKGSPHAVRVWVEHRGENYRLVADRENLKPVSAKVLPKTEVPTSADIEIIAENPVKAPKLLKISSKATDTAASAHEQNPKVPETAYRHVLWSFLLTREYGPDFAKKVTDAHEFRNDPEKRNNPDAETQRFQDFTNNEVGRKYAALGYNESDILNHVMTDPNVIY